MRITEPSPRAANRPHSHDIASRLLSWVPLAAGLAFTFGPIANNYGIALYFLNYHHGFAKRGLVGELVLPIAHFNRAGLAALEVAFILAAFAATYIVFRRLLFGSAQDRLLAAVLFAAPALLPHIANLFAQPDVTLYLLLLAAIAAFLYLTPNTAASVSTAVACVAMLAHEAFSLAFYPVIAAILWHTCRRRRLSWSVATTQIVLVALAFAAILHFGKLKMSPDVILAEACARTSVPIQRQVFDIMASDYTAQRALVAHFYRFPDFRQLILTTLLLSVPYFAMLAGLLRRATRALHYRRIDLTITLALFVLPLTLCWLGHDVSRWIADCAIDATLFLAYLALTEPPTRDALAAWASGPIPFLWLAWELLVGPYGATSLLAAQRLSTLWTGP